MAVTVIITDNEDGTGGVATIAGSAVGSTNTLYRALFDGVDGLPLNWVPIDSRTGDGTIDAVGPNRSYLLWYVKSVDGLTTSVSPVVLQALTDPEYAALRTRIITAIRDRVLLLDLQDIAPTKVLIRNSVDDPAQSFPSLIIVRDAVPDQMLGGTNARDDIGYPVQLLCQDQGNWGHNAPMAKWDLWREKIDDAFRNQRLPGVTEVYTCTIEPAVVAEPIPKLYAGTAVALTVRAIARKTRGIAA